MVSALYVASVEGYSGKTAMALGLALELKARGLNVGYFKPLGNVPVAVGGTLSDEDCVFMTKTLGLEDPLEKTCPVLLTPDLIEEPIRGPVTGIRKQIMNSYHEVAKGRDVVVVEGSSTLADGYALGVALPFLSVAMDAKVLMIIRYRRGLHADELLMAKDTLGDRLLGAIINSVPHEVKSYVGTQFPAFLARHGMASYGVLPADKLLMAITISELASLLDGDILCCREKLDEPVENFAVGAMNVDAALKYFLRMPNKAVITGGDRADIQMAALQTSTKVLVLTGNLQPDAVILGRAMELGVPIVVVKADTMRAIELVEKALGRIRLSSQRQIERLGEIIRKEVDLERLCQALGLS